MKYFMSVFLLSLITCSSFAARTGRPAMAKNIMSAPRYTASINQLNTMANATGNSSGTAVVEPVTEPEEEKIDMREAERNACLNNNIGIGNTFVWASRYSNTSNYANMVEDVQNPQNNVCFVRVELKSDDESRVSVADIAPKYFMWGEDIECGGWLNQKDMEQRILDTRKGARIGGIVASTVGGAGLGVGAMELFGNKLIGGEVEGQAALKGNQLYISKLGALEKEDNARFNSYVADLRKIKEAYRNGEVSYDDYDKYRELIDAFVK